jgi:hypothetical protein
LQRVSPAFDKSVTISENEHHVGGFGDPPNVYCSAMAGHSPVSVRVIVLHDEYQEGCSKRSDDEVNPFGRHHPYIISTYALMSILCFDASSKSRERQVLGQPTLQTGPVFLEENVDYSCGWTIAFAMWNNLRRDR